MKSDDQVNDLLRRLAPDVLGVLIRRFGRFDACEDAVQEALLAAAVQWPHAGLPDNPKAWLTTVALRRMTDQLRGESARRRTEATAAALDIAPAHQDLRLIEDGDGSQDDTLMLLFLCCHPELSEASQVALTLRAVGGLTTSQIARAFLVPEATMAQRISRAKRRMRSVGITMPTPSHARWGPRLGSVLHVLYLIFNEGYAASFGPEVHQVELSREAIRLTRQVHRLVPSDGEVTGLLALMLLTDARRPARTRPDGTLIALAEQDRTAWDHEAIAEGIALLSQTLVRHPIGPYQLQAAIAAVHDEAADADATDWRQILALYVLLEKIAPNPMVTLNKSVALGMVHGPHAGLEALATLDGDERMTSHHRVAAVRAHLLEMSGDLAGARESYRRAGKLTTSLPERRYLDSRAARLAQSGTSD